MGGPLTELEERQNRTYQDPVPHRAPIDTIALCPDPDRHRPGKENHKGLDEMDDIFGSPHVAARRPGHSKLHDGDGWVSDPRKEMQSCKGVFNPLEIHPTRPRRCRAEKQVKRFTGGPEDDQTGSRSYAFVATVIEKRRRM